MLRLTPLRAVALPTLALALAACAGDTPTAPSTFPIGDATLARSMADDAGSAVASQLAMYGDDGSSGRAGYQAAPPRAAAPLATNVTCAGPDASGWYSCDGTNTTSPNDLAFTRTFRYFADGAVVPAFGASVDSVQHTWLLTGTVTPAATRTIWVHRADTGSVQLQRSDAGAVTLRVWNAVGARRDSALATDGAQSRRWRTVASDSVRALAHAPGAAYPQGGTIVHDMATTFEAVRDGRTLTRTITRRVVATFDGTNVARLQVGDLACTLDLDTRQVSCP